MNITHHGETLLHTDILLRVLEEHDAFIKGVHQLLRSSSREDDLSARDVLRRLVDGVEVRTRRVA